jgi:hypothetical protein
VLRTKGFVRVGNADEAYVSAAMHFFDTRGTSKLALRKACLHLLVLLRRQTLHHGFKLAHAGFLPLDVELDGPTALVELACRAGLSVPLTLAALKRFRGAKDDVVAQRVVSAALCSLAVEVLLATNWEDRPAVEALARAGAVAELMATTSCLFADKGGVWPSSVTFDDVFDAVCAIEFLMKDRVFAHAYAARAKHALEAVLTHFSSAASCTFRDAQLAAQCLDAMTQLARAEVLVFSSTVRKCVQLLDRFPDSRRVISACCNLFEVFRPAGLLDGVAIAPVIEAAKRHLDADNDVSTAVLRLITVLARSHAAILGVDEFIEKHIAAIRRGVGARLDSAAVAAAHLHCRMLGLVPLGERVDDCVEALLALLEAHGTRHVEIASDAVKTLTVLLRCSRIHIYCACGGLGILQRVLEAHAHANTAVHAAMTHNFEAIRKRAKEWKLA